MDPVWLAFGAMILVAGGGTVVRLATGQFYFSWAVTRRQKNVRHLVTVFLLLVSLLVAWVLEHFAVVETRSAYAFVALVGGIFLLRAVFTEMGLRRRGKE